ncbi:MAG TPA: methyltransferase domain-containing protein [Streptosporangiaceae bacterium]
MGRSMGTVKTSYSQHELDELVASARPRTGWDFSRMRTLRAPVPFDYGEVVARYLRPSDEVLDVGTGDGRQFALLAGKFRRGLGIDTDPEMIRLAEREHSSPSLEFRVSSARLEGVARSFPVVINRHAVLDLGAVTAHLKPGGYFITQQVGERNMACVRQALGQSAGVPEISSQALAGAGLRVVAFCEYDVEYVVRDVESLVFWLNALDLAHADLAGSSGLASAATFNKILAGNVDGRGFVTNEHRYLAIGQAPV